jgi:uncharacterized OsmC-like protein/alpha/beta superfamily hydrolase
MPNAQVKFAGQDGQQLAGRLDTPDGPVRAYALFAHCFTCGKDSLAASRIAKALTEHGIAVLRFDFTGLGGSDGDFANTNFSSNVADLLAAVDHLRTHFQAPALMIGHSLGGAAVLAAAPSVPEVKAVVTIAAPSDPAHVVGMFRADAPRIEADGEAEVMLAGRPFKLRAQFLLDVAQQKLLAKVATLGRALLVMHSPVDDTVSIDNATQIFVAARHPRSFISLDNADHLLTRREDASYVASLIAAWSQRYLPMEPATIEPDGSARSVASAVSAISAMSAISAAGNPGALGNVGAITPVAVLGALPAGTVLVEETHAGGYQQRISAGTHQWLVDEPQSYGGIDSGPAPYDMLVAALGACTSITLRMYAQRKGWPLEHIAVSLHHEKIHATDCAACETREGKIDRIDREITLQGPLDEAQRAALLLMADKCPVHRTLHSEVLIRTRVTDDTSAPAVVLPDAPSPA